MNATNLITDYIIAGVLGILCLLAPFAIIFDNDTVVKKCLTDFHNPTLLAVTFAAVAYALGVIYNQFADKLEDRYDFYRRDSSVNDFEKNVEDELGISHHYALQYVVTKSNSGYDYLSFRRTMIRIFRVSWCLFFLFPPLHGFWSLVWLLSGHGMEISGINIGICIFSWAVAYSLTRGLRKLYRGYYAAIINFVKIIRIDELEVMRNRG